MITNFIIFHKKEIERRSLNFLYKLQSLSLFIFSEQIQVKENYIKKKTPEEETQRNQKLEIIIIKKL